MASQDRLTAIRDKVKDLCTEVGGLSREINSFATRVQANTESVERSLAQLVLQGQATNGYLAEIRDKVAKNATRQDLKDELAKADQIRDNASRSFYDRLNDSWDKRMESDRNLLLKGIETLDATMKESTAAILSAVQRRERRDCDNDGWLKKNSLTLIQLILWVGLLLGTIVSGYYRDTSSLEQRLRNEIKSTTTVKDTARERGKHPPKAVEAPAVEGKTVSR